MTASSNHALSDHAERISCRRAQVPADMEFVSEGRQMDFVPDWLVLPR